MAGSEDELTPLETAPADAPPQALSVIPPAPLPAASTRIGPYLAVVAAVVVAGAATVVFMSARPSARESVPARPATAVHSSTPRVTSIASPANAPLPHWSNRNQARWVSNHPKSVAFELAADRDVPVWMHRVQPLLVVRCLAHKAEVFVFTDSPARIEPEDENHTVNVAFDAEPVATERWMDSDEHDALFAPDGTAFARRLARSHTLRFGFTPHNAASVTVQFTTTGFDSVLERVASQCRM